MWPLCHTKAFESLGHLCCVSVLSVQAALAPTLLLALLWGVIHCLPVVST